MHTQLLEDGSMVLFSRLGADRWDPGRALDWVARLDFGAAFFVPPDYFPFPQLVAGRSHPDGSVSFAGSVQDLVVPGDMVERAGPDAGYTAYWYTRFSPDGDLIWKRFYPVNALDESRMYGMTTQDGSLVIAGSKRERVSTDLALYYVPQYSWVRKVDPDGRTLFHSRYLDLPKLEGLQPTEDGGLLLYGLNYVESGGSVFGTKQTRLLKLGSDGEVDWARQLQDDLTLRTVLPLSDGTYLVSLGYDLTFARMNDQGWLPNCPGFQISETRMRMDNEPAQFDQANQVPLTLLFQDTGGEQEELPALGWSAATYSVQETCRSFP